MMEGGNCIGPCAIMHLTMPSGKVGNTHSFVYSLESGFNSIPCWDFIYLRA